MDKEVYLMPFVIFNPETVEELLEWVKKDTWNIDPFALYIICWKGNWTPKDLLKLNNLPFRYNIVYDDYELDAILTRYINW